MERRRTLRWRHRASVAALDRLHPPRAQPAERPERPREGRLDTDVHLDRHRDVDDDLHCHFDLDIHGHGHKHVDRDRDLDARPLGSDC